MGESLIVTWQLQLGRRSGFGEFFVMFVVTSVDLETLFATLLIGMCKFSKHFT